MLKNLSSQQILLIGIAAILLIIAAFAFYLLQNPSAVLPFSDITPTLIATLPATELPVQVQPTSTPSPTRQTSYTPFATLLTVQAPFTSAPADQITGTITLNPSLTSTPSPTKLPSQTNTPSAAHTASATPTKTPIPTISMTLLPGEYGVTGRILQNGSPVVNAVVEFRDDVDQRQSATDQKGYYSFITLAPGTEFKLTFNQDDNAQLIPGAYITSLARIEGSLPINANPIQLPDLEVSIDLDDVLFEPQTPADGSTYAASLISQANRFQFVWSQYNPGGSYHVELYPFTSDVPIWTSNQTSSTNMRWNGILDDGTHITEGTYWWRVAASRVIGSYTEVIFTQSSDITFNP
jgi:hypothetical protein